MSGADLSDFRVSNLRQACSHCGLNQLCLPVALSEADMEQLDTIVDRRKPLKRGSHLYRAGDEFKAIYAVRSGSLKTFVVTESGEEQVTGFHLPGLPYGPSLIPLDILIAVTAAARDDEPLTVRQLVDALPHSVIGIRYNLKRLIADGWVERTQAEWDRRIVFLLPTEREVKALQSMAAAL